MQGPYAGLVDAGPVQITGAGVDQFRTGTDPVTTSHYFFFQNASAFSPETLAQFQLVPEPSTLALVGCGIAVALIRLAHRKAEDRRI